MSGQEEGSKFAFWKIYVLVVMFEYSVPINDTW